MEKYAYATIITNNNYTPCIKRNAQRMRYLNCKYPYIVMFSDNLSNNDIKTLQEEPNIILKKFHYIDFLSLYIEKKMIKNGHNLNHFYYEKDTLHKFQILSLIDYNSILFLDADILILENLDKSFTKYKIPQNKNFIFINTIDKNFKNKNNLNNITMGEKFFCKPDLKLYNFLYKLICEQIYWNDEHVAKEIFFNNINSYNFQDILTFHFSGIIKIWNIPNDFLHYLFYVCNSDEFNYLIDNYWVDGIEKIGLLNDDISRTIKEILRNYNFYNKKIKAEIK